MTVTPGPTRKPPAGDAGRAAGTTALTEELRGGDSRAFSRFHELYRTDAYDLVLLLTRGSEEAAALTQAAFAAAYRDILLADGPRDARLALLTAAVAVCREHAGPGTGGDQGSPEATSPAARDSVERRVREALAELDVLQVAALALTDIHGLGRGDLAAPLGLTPAEVPAFLFRAGEDFRRAWRELQPRAGRDCGLAEQAAVGSVGLGLTEREERLLREHVRYCRPCRRVADSWPAGGQGLGLLLTPATLPADLLVPPVFGALAAAPLAPVMGPAGAAAGSPARLRGRLTGRSAAWTLAAVCLAATAAMAVYVATHDWRQVVYETLPAPVRITLQRARAELSATAQTTVAFATTSVPVSRTGAPLLVASTSDAGASSSAGDRAQTGGASAAGGDGPGGDGGSSAGSPPASGRPSSAAARSHRAHRHAGAAKRTGRARHGRRHDQRKARHAGAAGHARTHSRSHAAHARRAARSGAARAHRSHARSHGGDGRGGKGKNKKH